MTEPATLDTIDLHCPLCEYNLRGLVDPRCPECGFTFTWEELRAADRNRHPWLFEHYRQRGLPSLWTTWRRNRRPRRFWRDVTPANPVNVSRLILYWATVGGLASVLLLLLPLPHGLTQASHAYFIQSLYALPGWPPPSVKAWLASQCNATTLAAKSDPFSPNVIGPPLLVLAWPWLSFASLMVFRRSMRHARVGGRHVLRVVVYGSDFGLIVWLAVVAFLPAQVFRRGWSVRADGVPLAYLAMVFGALATARLTVAYARYLRFHRPFATVLASQLVVVIFVLTTLTLTTDLGYLFR